MKPGRSAGGAGCEDISERAQEAAARSGAVCRRRRWQARAQVGHLRHEACGLRCDQGRDGRDSLRTVRPSAELSHRVEHGGVRKLRLRLGRAHDDSHGSSRAGPSRELVGEPRLADAGLTLDHDEAAVGCGALPGRDQARELGVPVHERERDRSVHRRRRCRRLRGRLDDLAGADLLVELGRLGERGDAELAMQRADAGPVLLDRGAPIAHPGV